MPWSNQPGGGGGKGGPGGGNGGGQGPWGGGSGGGQGPNFEDMLRRGQDKFRGVLPGGLGSKRAIFLILLAVVVIWLASGFYRVQPDERGVELVFGKWVATTNPGLNYNWPAPIGQVLKPQVTKVEQVEVGFRSKTRSEIQAESQMLTGDENIIDIEFVVHWKIDDRVGKNGVRNFLFNIRNPELTIKNTAEAAMREVIGKSRFEFARTQGRVKVAAETKELLQRILDSYGAGVFVRAVQIQKVDPPGNVLKAFRDVQAARADKERAINVATAYLAEIVNRSQGDAARIVNAGEAYRAEQVAKATGETSRFLAVYKQYLQDKRITKRRIYMEALSEVLGRIDKVFIDQRKGAPGVLPYLPLESLRGPRTSTAPSGGGASTAGEK
ncbi:MAG: FtsH protease activity modulator HflK [Alphaproteobacteria bacterium]